MRLTDFGAFVELSNGVEGLLHVSEISHQHVKKPEDVLAVGQEITAKVIKLDEENRRIGLSIKAYEEEVRGPISPEEEQETGAEDASAPDAAQATEEAAPAPESAEPQQNA